MSSCGTVSCNGGSAAITVGAAGGTAPYTGTGIFSAGAGLHTYTINDANGCSATTSVNISQPSSIITSVTNGSILCNGGTTTINVTAAGGNAPYTGIGVFTVSAGTHTFSVSDANGCSTTVTRTVTQPSVLNASIVSGAISGFAGTTTVAISAIGGTSPYVGTGTFTAGAGTHTYTILDANSCSTTLTLTLLEPSQLIVSTAQGSILCHGGTTTVNITANGGVAPYTGTGIFTVSAGTNTYLVTDANNNVVTATITLSQPTQLTATSSLGNILCYGGLTTVTVSANGGTAPYIGTGTYSAEAGTHTYLVTDATGCSTTTTLTLSQPLQLSASSLSGSILCYGGSTAYTVSATGGTAPYTGLGTFTAGAGNYTNAVTDVNGCSSVASITITQPSQLTVSVLTGTILTFGGTSTVNIGATGGTLPYSGTGTFTATAGTHTYSVSDANGCSKTVTVTLSQPGQLFVSATHGSILCYGGTATVNIVASGGVAPYSGIGTFTASAGTHTYQVTDANNTPATATVIITQPSLLMANAANSNILCYGSLSTVSVSANGGTLPYTGTGNYSRSEGVHSFTVSDANGCSTITTVTITQPSQLLVASNGGSIQCNGASTTITITAVGGTSPYFGTGTYTSLAGTHSYSVADANGCFAIATVTLTQPTQLTASSLSGTITLFGGSTTVTISANGGTAPYTGIGTFSAGSGSHTYTVTDANGCSVTQTITLVEPGELIVSSAQSSISCYGGVTTVSISANGGVAPYSGTGSFTVFAGSHTFAVTDANNNTANTIVTITQPTQLVASSLSGNVLCSGATTSVIVSATGGSAPYSGIGTFSVISGIHIYTVSDANACSAITTVTITQPTPVVVSASSGSILCNSGTSNVTVTASGGTLPYNGVGVFNRSAGTHSFLITDTNGCSAVATVTLVQPNVLTASAVSGSIGSFGGTTTVAISAIGGTSPYVGTGTFTAGAGTHTYTILDANSCSTTLTLTLLEPSQLIVSTAQGSILCHGGTTTVNITANGGVAPYTGTGIFTVSAGTNTYLVTDANNNVVTATITLSQPTQLTATSSLGNILCYGGLTTVTVSANGGTAPYIGTGTYSAEAGTHTYLVTDATGCSTTTTLTLSQPLQLSASSLSGSILCYGGSTAYTVSATGGTAPYTGLGTFTAGAGNYTNAVTDVNGCSSVASITITQPSQLTVSVLTGTILTFGGTSTVNIGATGGTLPYSGTGTFTATAGTHTYSVSDANGCSKTVTVTLSQPGQLFVSATHGSILCYGGTATVNIVASGGVAPYSGIGTFTASAGTHTYQVTDANNTPATATVIITQPLQLFASSVAGNILCHGGTTTVTVSASGGTAAYMGTGTFTANVGAHTYTVSDANGCLAFTSLTITQPLPLNVSSSHGNILCYGGTTTVSVSANGGTAPYINAGTHTVAAGTFSVLVSDANGCSVLASDTVTQPSQLMAVSQSSNILCHGGATTASVTATGGTAPYLGNVTYTANAGSHTYTVIDANGCSASTSITITQPLQLTTIANAGTIFCYGGITTLTILANGGTAPYVNTGTHTVAAGSYSFVVSDANGCLTSVSDSITQPSQFFASSVSGGILCYGGVTTVSVYANGGTLPYSGIGSYTTNSGVHTYSVADANGCSAATTVTITQPSQMSVTATSGNILCYGGSATVSIAASGGVAPYNGLGVYTSGAGVQTYSVSDTNGCFATTSVTITQPVQLVASSTNGNILCAGGTVNVNITANGGTPTYNGIGTVVRNAGIHSFTVTDANACLAVTTLTVTEPLQLTAIVNSASVSCYGGVATVTVSATGGLSPYSGVGTFTANAGSHSYTVTDVNGCSSIATITISQPAQLTASAISSSALCNGGTATITVSASGGLAPYLGIGSFVATNGFYTYTVTDLNGCSALATATITQPSQISVSAVSGSVLCHGDITTVTITASGGSLPYTGVGNYTATAGTHTYSVTDANGCSSTATLLVAQPIQLIASTSHGVVLCNGGITTVTVSASGGNAPYTGLGIYTVSAGAYTFVVNDTTACSSSVSITITEPLPFTLNLMADSILCHGALTSVSISATGGTAPYVGTGTYTVLAGLHTFSVTDALGCSSSTVFSISEPAPFVVGFAADSILCYGGTTTATISASGGTGPYTGVGVFTVSASMHTFSVTDAYSCSASTVIAITEPAQFAVNFERDSILCSGGTANATISATGGVPLYTGTGIVAISAGTQTFVVTDAVGCSASTVVTVTEPAALVVSFVTDSILCNGGLASATISALGGVAPYAGTGQFLYSPGLHTAFVSDANGCSALASRNVTEPDPLQATFIMDSVRCFGGFASIHVSALGGTLPYSGIGTFTAIIGTHSFAVVDTNGCSSSTLINVTQPPQLIAGAIVNSNILCYGDSASVTVFALGGSGYYFNYVTDSMPCMNDTLRAMLAANGGTVPYWGPDTYMVPPGSYTYGVVDSHCCWDTAEIVITAPPQLTLSSTMGPVPCFGAQTTLTVEANGGTVPYFGTGIYNVTAGSYTYQVFDANGCSENLQVLVDTSTCTGVEDYEFFERGKLRIYPNPNNGSFKVSGIEEGKAQLLNQAGQLVKELVFKDNEEVVVEELAEGMYFFVSSRVRVKIVVLH